MKKIISFLSSRLFLCGILIFIQLFSYVFMLCCVSAYSPYIYAFMVVISLIFTISVVGDDMNPSFKVAWIIALLTLPVFAWMLYLILGRRRVSYEKRKLYEIIKKKRKDYDNSTILSEIESLDKNAAKQFRFISSGKAKISKGTSTLFYRSGEEFLPDFLDALNSAEHYILLEYFIISKGEMWSEILGILKKKAACGIGIYVMYDDLGTIALLPDDFDKELERYGISTCIFNRLRPSVDVFLNYRDHRKIAVIDGKYAFTGGVNLSDEYINLVELHGYWKDYAIKVEGEAVRGFIDMFLELWEFGGKTPPTLETPDYSVNDDGYVIPFGDGPMNERLTGKMSYINAISCAFDYVYIITPYLILDSETVTALCLSAQSGTDVRIITPHIPDKRYVHAVTRANYPSLIKAGVRIFEFRKGFVHAKSIVSDNKTAIIGTTNFDFRSFYLHFENGVFLYNTNSVKKIKKDFTDTLAECIEITCESIDSQGPLKRFVNAFIRLFSPFL